MKFSVSIFMFSWSKLLIYMNINFTGGKKKSCINGENAIDVGNTLYDDLILDDDVTMKTNSSYIAVKKSGESGREDDGIYETLQ